MLDEMSRQLMMRDVAACKFQVAATTGAQTETMRGRPVPACRIAAV